MQNYNEPIEFTPIESVFSESELERIMEAIEPEPKKAHKNSCELAVMFRDKYPTIEYCEGLIRGDLPHAFNSMEIDGVRHYFDITSYMSKLKQGIEPVPQGTLMRTFAPKEIFEKMVNHNAFFLTIVHDGTVSNVWTDIMARNKSSEALAIEPCTCMYANYNFTNNETLKLK